MAKRKADTDQEGLALDDAETAARVDDLAARVESVVDAIWNCPTKEQAALMLLGLLEGAPEVLAEVTAGCNATLQHSTDAVGTWLMLITADGTAIPLTCFGPDRAELRDQVLATLDRAE